MIFQSVLRGVGEVRLPMLIISVTVFLNFLLDPVFMFGWGPIPPMGVAGVAWATLITESLSALVGLSIFLAGKYDMRIKLKYLVLQKSWIKQLLKLGTPSSLEMSSRSFGMILMTFIVSTFGTLAVAAYGIGIKALMLIIIPGIGFSMSTSTLVGNNLGAGKLERADKIVKTGMKVGFVTLGTIGVFAFIFAKQLVGFLVPGEAELIDLAAVFIRIMALTFGFIGIQMVIIGTVRAAGQTMISMFLALTHTFTLFVFAYIFSTIFHLEELGLWIAYPSANFVTLAAAIYFYFRKDWLRKKLV
jgi:putative MATE family efflux protein